MEYSIPFSPIKKDKKIQRIIITKNKRIITGKRKIKKIKKKNKKN